MEVKQLVIGPIATNTYILSDQGHCILIDPAANPKRILSLTEGLQVDGIALTHGHFDHIGAVDELVKKLHCSVYISSEDEEMLRDPRKNGSDAVRIMAEVQHYEPVTTIGQFMFEVMEASGHTKGSVLLMCGEMMFCGDVLFKNSIGRCDLFGGSDSQMKATLKKIKSFRVNYTIFPGHGEITTLDEEFKFNPFLQ